MRFNQILACFSILACCLIFVSSGLGASLDQYEPDNTIETAKQILLNESDQIRNFYDPNDEDWVKFDVKKDNYYRIISSFPGINCDPVIEIYDKDAISDPKRPPSMVTDHYGIGYEEMAEFLAEYDGTYYARIRQYDTKNLFGQASYGEGTEYHLTLTMPYVIADKYEPDNTIETAKKILLNPMLSESQLPPGYEWEQIRNFYAPNDEDWVKVDVKKDNYYKLIVNYPGINCDPVIDIYDNNKQLTDYQLIKSEYGYYYTDFLAKYDGVYYARVRQCDIKNPLCHASYGQGTEYHLTLIMPYINASGRINVYIDKNAESKITLTDNKNGKVSDVGYSETLNCYTGLVEGSKTPDNYTLRITAVGYDPYEKKVSIEECDSPDCIVKEYILLKPLSFSSCIHADGLVLNICADYKNTKYGDVILKSDINAQFWKMDISNPVVLQTDPGNCVYLDPNFPLYLCFEYSGNIYGIILKPYDLTQLIWERSQSDLFAKFGDFNNDSQVDLRDAIFVLRIITDISVTDNINLNADVNGDKKIGIEDVIYVLQKVAGLRN